MRISQTLKTNRSRAKAYQLKWPSVAISLACAFGLRRFCNDASFLWHKESHWRAQKVRAGKPTSCACSAADDPPVGCKVRAIFADDGQWYPAQLVHRYENGTSEVRWDDPDGGPICSLCDSEEIKRICTADDFKVGDLVEAEHPEDGQWYTGLIESAAPEGAFVVKWDDPDDGVDYSSCKPEAMTKLFIEYAQGDVVDALDDGEWYPGTVVNVNGDGSFQIQWDDPDDGPESACVWPKNMKKVRVFSGYATGDLVEAVFPDDGQWYDGSVASVHDNGTFEVRWEDVDEEGPISSVCAPRFMRPKIIFEAYQVGDVVTAKFDDDGEWYPGVVDSVNGDGTFMVKWDYPDGGPESSSCAAADMKLSEDSPEDLFTVEWYGDGVGGSDFNSFDYAETAIEDPRQDDDEDWETLVRRRRTPRPPPMEREEFEDDVSEEAEDYEEDGAPSAQDIDAEETEESVDIGDGDGVVASNNAASLFTKLQELDPGVAKDDYFNEEADEWDIDGLMDDLRLAQEEQAS